MAAEPRWLSRAAVDLIHQELIAEHGGSLGIRAEGEGLIESALERPRHRWAYEPTSDLPDLAGAYLYGLATNPAYLDGNKRVAFAVAATFLHLNGLRLVASEVEAYSAVIDVIEGRLSEEGLAAWFRDNTVLPRP